MRNPAEISEEDITDRIVTVPNLLTLVRLLLVPLFVWVFVVRGENLLGCIIFAVASLSDFLDGYIARATHSISRIGIKFDPFVDRILVFAGVAAVFIVDRAPLWMLLLLVIRDLSLGILILVMRNRGDDFRVILLGKITTAVLMVGFASLILDWPMLPGLGIVESSWLPGWGVAKAALGIWMLYIGVVISWITAGLYFYRGVRH